MKHLFRLPIYAFLVLLLSCVDHRIPPPIFNCDEALARLQRCVTWRLTSRLVNNIEAINTCQQGISIIFIGRLGPGGTGPSNNFIYSPVTVDPEFCGTGSGIELTQGSFQCNNGLMTLGKRINFVFNSRPSIDINQTLNFLTPSSFLLSYTDSQGNAIVETYVTAGC